MVCNGHILSIKKTIEEGAPQGSELSCTLFSIAINKICKDRPSTVQCSLYVDDFALFASGSSTHMIERRLQTAISKLEAWCMKTGFQFSQSKTVSLHVCRK